MMQARDRLMDYFLLGACLCGKNLGNTKDDTDHGTKDRGLYTRFSTTPIGLRSGGGARLGKRISIGSQPAWRENVAGTAKVLSAEFRPSILQ